MMSARAAMRAGIAPLIASNTEYSLNVKIACSQPHASKIFFVVSTSVARSLTTLLSK